MSCFWGALSAGGQGGRLERVECQQAPGQDQVASELCGTEGHHSCSSGPSVVVSGGRFVWCCEVGWGRGSACGGSQSGEGMSSAGEGSARGVHRGPHASSRPDPRPLAPANSRMSHLQATHPRQAELRAAPPCPAQRGKQQAARAVRSLVSRYASRCASSQLAQGAGGAGRVQWVASLRPASSGSAGRASAAAPRPADWLISSQRPRSRPPRERIDRDREEVCLSFCQKVGEALRTLCS